MIGIRRRPDAGTAKEPYRPPQLNLLREIRVESPVHRLWAGTKLLVLAGLSITLSYFPSWGSIGIVTITLLAAVLAARVPSGAWPRPPKWFWLTLVAAGALASIAGGSPHVHIGGVVLGLGAFDAYCRFVLVGVLLLLAAAVLGWTTPLGEIAPAVARLMWPLRLVRVPVDELSTAAALCVRSLPLLFGDMRTLIAARRLRPPPERPNRSDVETWLDELVDLMTAAIAVAVRRSGELAEAITARGGTGAIAARVGRPRAGDAAVLLGTAGLCFAATLFPV